jgi:glycosyltransferase involved in cell wall biosynthesis
VNILSFADTRFPIERANGVQTMATCRAVAARGHHVTLLVRPDTAVPPRDPFAFYGVDATPTLAIQVIHTRGGATGRRVQMLWSAVRRALAGGIDLVYTRDLGLAAVLARVPASRRPRLVYESHGIAPVVSAAMPALLGQPHLAPSQRKIARLDRREALVWQRADAYVTITQTLADDLAARYGARAAVHVVPDGAAPAAPRPGDSVASRTRLRVAYAGHLYPWKGVDVFLHALAQAPALDGLIIGGHPGEADLARVTALAHALGLLGTDGPDRLTISGLLPPPSVAAALATADILVLPNTATAISERYTSPLKLFEYLARGAAIVASDLPAIREVLTHDVTAWLVPPGDAAALAAACTALATDTALRRRLGEAARVLSADYTWDLRAARIERAFEAARSA